MAHELDVSTGIAAIAYVQGSDKPWHGLGQTVDPSAPVCDWKRAAGLDWQALRSEVTYLNETTGQIEAYADKQVLYRSDTGQPLSVVSRDYRTVQPDDILNFFGDLADSGGFSIETVGALKEGRRIWALGRVGDNARILDDEVAPYLLLATSYDGSMATLAKFTAVRVVCHNTLQASLRNAIGQRQVTLSHQAIFDPKQLRADLGIARDAWESFQQKAGLMAARKITDAERDAWLLELFEPFMPYGQSYSPEQVFKSKAYARIVDLYQGGQLGAGMDAVNDTVWGLLHATTQYIDHEKGRLRDNRLDAAWFGSGARLKEHAFDLAEQLAA
jgi:phage/plasmid-like protein (TIGR03299 family)